MHEVFTVDAETSVTKLQSKSWVYRIQIYHTR